MTSSKEEFLKRSYMAVDGLWFVKIEEQFGFQKALDLDEKVWEVMPKIQARKARELLNLNNNGIKALKKGLGLKLSAENYNYKFKTNKSDLKLEIISCPWLEILEKSNRVDIAPKIAKHICFKEMQGWGKEFNVQKVLLPDENICLKDVPCKFIFKGHDKDGF